MNIHHERIIVFGGTGSLGKKLIERFSHDSRMLVYSRDEAKHWTIKNELTLHDSRAGNKNNVHFCVGDVRDVSRIAHTLRNFQPTIIIIAAALKHVDTCELSPIESIATNLVGTQNIIKCAQDHFRELSMKGTPRLKVLFVSTDKACAPVNVYGMCKALSERLVTSCAISDDCWSDGLDYLCTRYGNVLESRGSIIPLFKFQAANARELTVTDPDMTRFVMTLNDSVDLIEHTLINGRSGETWIPIIPAMRIGDLAEIFSEISGKPINVIGLRPGEKKHEELISESESVRVISDLDERSELKNHHVIGSVIGPFTKHRFTYTSNQKVMTKEKLRQHLATLHILDAPLEAFKGKQIEEIKIS